MSVLKFAMVGAGLLGGFPVESGVAMGNNGAGGGARGRRSRAQAAFDALNPFRREAAANRRAATRRANAAAGARATTRRGSVMDAIGRTRAAGARNRAANFGGGARRRRGT